MPRAVVLVNPRSRAGGRAPIARILSTFRGSGWEAEAWIGDRPQWTAEAAGRAVTTGVDAIFGAGGDGMLRDILPAVVGTEVALGVVPLGTGNVWARELGLPLSPERAISAQLQQPPRLVDTGVANGRPFLVIASVGLDAQIVTAVEAGGKAFGQIAYPLAGLAIAQAVRGVPCAVQVDDEPPFELRLLMGIAANGRLYGGLVPLTREARLDDGHLDFALFAGDGPIHAAAHTAKVLAGLHGDDPNIVLRKGRRLTIRSLAGEELPLETDGDLRGSTPLEVEVRPRSLYALGATAAP